VLAVVEYITPAYSAKALCDRARFRDFLKVIVALATDGDLCAAEATAGGCLGDC